MAMTLLLPVVTQICSLLCVLSHWGYSALFLLWPASTYANDLLTCRPQSPKAGKYFCKRLKNQRCKNGSIGEQHAELATWICYPSTSSFKVSYGIALCTMWLPTLSCHWHEKINYRLQSWLDQSDWLGLLAIFGAWRCHISWNPFNTMRCKFRIPCGTTCPTGCAPLAFANMAQALCKKNWATESLNTVHFT